MNSRDGIREENKLKLQRFRPFHQFYLTFGEFQRSIYRDKALERMIFLRKMISVHRFEIFESRLFGNQLKLFEQHFSAISVPSGYIELLNRLIHFLKLHPSSVNRFGRTSMIFVCENSRGKFFHIAENYFQYMSQIPLQLSFLITNLVEINGRLSASATINELNLLEIVLLDILFKPAAI